MEHAIQQTLSSSEPPCLPIRAVLAAGILAGLSSSIYPLTPVPHGVTGSTPISGHRCNRLRTLIYIGGLALVYGRPGLTVVLTGQLFGSVARDWLPPPLSIR